MENIIVIFIYHGEHSVIVLFLILLPLIMMSSLSVKLTPSSILLPPPLLSSILLTTSSFKAQPFLTPQAGLGIPALSSYSRCISLLELFLHS